MKKQVLFLFLLISAGFVFAQAEIQLRPLNPSFETYMTAKQNGTFNNVTESGYYLGEVPSPLVKNFDSFVSVSAKGLPVSYDLRSVDGGIYLTPVKNQGAEGACWAFATYAAIESYWKKIGLSTYDLSEQHLATCHGFDWLPSEGGNSDLSTAYLARRSGPILESDNPYTLPSNPNCVGALTPVAYVAQARDLPGKGTAGYSANIVKQAIMDYGVLYTNMHWADNYMSNTNKTYYYNGSEGTNHGVAIVGWDNNKTVTGGSAATPSQPGAWIIKNSWGPSWGESGYFYISYQDTKALTSIAYFPSHIEYNANTEVYYYDDYGAIGSLGYSDGNDCGLIKFTASANQQITKLGTYVVDAASNISFDVFSSFNGSTLSGPLGSISAQYCEYPGYYTFDLPTPINVNENSDFYIRVRYNSGQNFPVPVEYQYAGYTTNATTQTGKSWLSSNGTTGWMALGSGTDYDYDLCIKAYAVNIASEPPVADFTADNLTITMGQAVNFTDISSGIPNNWAWTFEGGTPGTASTANPSVIYNTPGTYDVTLYVSNAHGFDEITKENYITVTSAPITCEYYDNFDAADALVYYTTTGGYVTGINGYNFLEFAEYYNSHLNHNVTGFSIVPAQADVLSANAKITMKIWNVVAGKPGTVLYSEDFNISSFTTDVWNDVSFASSTVVPDEFFIGYQIYVTNPQDTFAVYQAEDRGPASLVSATGFIKYNNVWQNIDDLFQNGFNSSFAIAPEICPSFPNADFIADVTNGCNSLTVQFTDQTTSNPDSWLWDFGDGNTSTEQNPSHTYINPGTYTVSLEATNAIGSDTFSQEDYIVIVETPAAVTVSGGTTQCGGSVVLSASGGAGGVIYWQGITSNGTSTANELSEYTVTESGTYYFRALAGANCWGEQGSTLVTINTVPGTIEISGGGTICGDNTTLIASGGANGTIYWQGTTEVGTSTANSNVEQLITTNGTYYFRAQSAEGCWGEQAMVTVSLNPVPAIVAVSGSGTQCGGTINLVATGGEGGIIYWQGTTNNGTSTTTAASEYNITESGTYYFRAQSAEGCWGEQGSAAVEIFDVPTAVIVSGGGTQCGGTMILTANGGTGGTIYFQGTTSNGTNTTNASTSETITTSGTYYFRAVSTDGCWSEEGSAEVIIHPALEISLLATDESAPGANDGSIEVTILSGTAPYTYTWAAPIEDETTGTISNLSGGIYCLTIEDSNDCSAYECTTINTIGASPISSFTADVVFACENLTVQFTDLSLNYPETWDWDFGDGATSTDQNPAHTYTQPGYYTVSLTASNTSGTGTVAEYTDFIHVGGGIEIAYISTPASGQLIADGGISLDISGGSEPYQISWSHDAGQTNAIIANITTGTYFVTIVDNDGCTQSEEIFVDWTTFAEGINNVVSIYPNPADDFVNVVFESRPDKITIYNILGKCVYEASPESNNTRISIKEFASGTYILNIVVNETTHSAKLIVK